MADCKCNWLAGKDAEPQDISLSYDQADEELTIKVDVAGELKDHSK